MGLPAKCMHFVGSPGWRGNSNSPRDGQLIRSAPEHDEDFDRVSRITHKRLPFERKRGVGLSFQHLERNKDEVLFSERISKIFFLLSAKGSENAQGEFSERGPHRKKFRRGIFPPGNPKTPHTPTNEKRARREHSPPYLRGQRGIVSKRKSEINKQAVNTMREAGTGRSYAIKADGKEYRPLFMNFNLMMLSRARKILQACLANFFDAIP